MAERTVGAVSKLARVRQSLERWRSRSGGRGRPIPADFWAEAVALARIEGVEVTARALRLDRARLAARLHNAAETSDDDAAAGGFVEVDAACLCGAGPSSVRLVGRDGERLEITLSPRDVVDITALVGAFWARPR